jgi:hypothetical protein
MDIKEISIDIDFDENFYSSLYPETICFYQPYCQENNIDDRRRLFYHYSLYKNEGIGRFKNRKELLNYYDYDFCPIKDKICIIVHVHYFEVWEQEIKPLIKNLDVPRDIYITINNKEYEKTIKEQIPESNIILLKNSGADIAPFVKTIQHINSTGKKYKYILKLHTKKSSQTNEFWTHCFRNSVYKNLCKNLSSIVLLLEVEESIGMIGSPNTRLSLTHEQDFINEKNFNKIRKLLKIEDNTIDFIYGTMFVVRYDIINYFLTNLNVDIFEKRHKSDGTIAHAFERLFGNMIREFNKRIYVLGEKNEESKLFVPTSVGDLIDKVTILTIKKIKINDEKKSKNICKELKSLELVLESKKINYDKNYLLFFDKLININKKLWEVEDKIRHIESTGRFDDEFTQTARQVYQFNDIRAKIKKDVNLHYKSQIVEEKSYGE